MIGLAMRIVSDLVLAPIVASAIGWLIDDIFNTRPIFLIIFFFIGLATGIINVMRIASEMNQAGQKDKIDE